MDVFLAAVEMERFSKKNIAFNLSNRVVKARAKDQSDVLLYPSPI